jgi:hypothetical protein
MSVKIDNARVQTWGDLYKGHASMRFGVEVKIGSKWMPCCEGKEPLLYETYDEALGAAKALLQRSRLEGAAS